jgi:hypothetical protein
MRSYVCWRTDDFVVPAQCDGMLYELIKENRELLLSRSAELSAENSGHSRLQTASLGHVFVFLDQLIIALHAKHGAPNESGQTSEKLPDQAPSSRLSRSAFSHGLELRDSDLTIDEVVRNYGSICQAITGYAVEVHATIDPADFQTLNWCLDEAISQAVIAFTALAPSMAGSLKAVQSAHDIRLDDLASMSGQIECMANAVAAIRTGRVGIDGATGALLDEGLSAMRTLIEKGVDQQF